MQSPATSTACRVPRGVVYLAVTTVVGLGLDLWTKSLSTTLLAPGDSYPFIPGYLHFETVQNHGAVFGLGQGYRWLFVLVSLAAIAFVAYLFRNGMRRWWYDMTLGMLLAGILGNLYDRIVHGHVRDMIHAFPGYPRLFPYVFNLADSLLCVSIAILLISGFFVPDGQPTTRDTSRS